MLDPTPYLRTPEAAKHLNVSESLLEKMRLNRKGPVFFRVPDGRTVFYRRCDLDAWITGTRSSTSQAA